jgi:hypothetical protein
VFFKLKKKNPFEHSQNILTSLNKSLSKLQHYAFICFIWTRLKIKKGVSNLRFLHNFMIKKRKKSSTLYINKKLCTLVAKALGCLHEILGSNLASHIYKIYIWWGIWCVCTIYILNILSWVGCRQLPKSPHFYVQCHITFQDVT